MSSIGDNKLEGKITSVFELNEEIVLVCEVSTFYAKGKTIQQVIAINRHRSSQNVEDELTKDNKATVNLIYSLEKEIISPENTLDVLLSKNKDSNFLVGSIKFV
ncbi:hypothetical protein SD80_012635 [Scytonema tolypothrichoides VB-61278]|nr:hypothetical protein SD80_012635 [Scytonema tolypothrichoides VB-61278]